MQHLVQYRKAHLAWPPHEEAKLVRCTRGASHHIILDLRKGSETYLASTGVDLSAEMRSSLYVPEGVAHGFITLEQNTEIFYQISKEYVPEAAMGVRWDDPVIRIDWPVSGPILSAKDEMLPCLAEVPHEFLPVYSA